MSKNAPPPALPPFALQKWHKVYAGLQLTWISLACVILALLPVIAVGIVKALDLETLPITSPHYYDRNSVTLGWLGSVWAIVIAAVCVVFAFLGQFMCCAAPAASGAKRWMLYSLFLYLFIVLPVALICVSGMNRVGLAASGLTSLSASDIRYGISYPFLGLNIAATLAHILFVIGLLQVNRAFAIASAVRFATACLIADLVSLGIIALLFTYFVAHTSAAASRSDLDASLDDAVMAATVVGTPTILGLAILVMFLSLLLKTRKVVAKAIAERTGIHYLLQ